ncbi:MAG: response regulator transcription factor [Magnetospirillum sp.]|nr:response regulator transcription factor [Magnetospirillum sp.]
MTIVLAGENRLAKDSLAETIGSMLNIPVVCVDNLGEAAGIFPGISAESLLLVDYDLARGAEDWDLLRSHVSPAFRVAVFSAPGSPDEAMRWLHMGWDGYLPRTMSASAIVCAIRLMLRGERFVPSITIAATQRVSLEPAFSEGGLSPRQRQILSLVATGASNKHIARALSVEEVTVKSHIKAIFRKLNVRSRTEAARYAFGGRTLVPVEGMGAIS